MSKTRRGQTGLAGILPLDKPHGMTSHDVVARVRRATGERRVGHAGTLDPMATGLLVVLVGPFTRLTRYLSAERKSYEALVVFGEETDTLDADGAHVRSAPVPDAVLDPLEAAFTAAALVGEHRQVPPAYSALKLAGRKAYEMARSGQAPELRARDIEIHSAQLLAVDAGPPPAWRLLLDVSKGTYVRSIARDLGEAIGTVAHLGELRRLSSGAITLGDAATLEESELAAGDGKLEVLFADPALALGLPEVSLSEDDAASVAAGRALTAPEHVPDGWRAAMVDAAGLLLAVYVRRGEVLRAETVIGRAPEGRE